MLLFILIIFIFIFSVVVHEVAHGTMAYHLGDPTAKYAGRLTLNPLAHLDPIGSIILPLFLIILSKISGGGIIFGWAKPVPINPYNFRDQKYGSAKTAIAGPLANLSIALIFGLLLRCLLSASPSSPSSIFFFRNLTLVFSYIVWINLLLGLFNLLPIPPLDGSHILFAFLPHQLELVKSFLQHYSLLLLLFFIFFLFQWFIPLLNFLFRLIVGVYFF